MNTEEFDDQNKWSDIAKGLLKAELVKRNISFKDLATLLKEEYGIDENPTNLSNKIARGTFSASFMIQCLKVIKCDTLRIEW
jgi:hypothetical protein